MHSYDELRHLHSIGPLCNSIISTCTVLSWVISALRCLFHYHYQNYNHICKQNLSIRLSVNLIFNLLLSWVSCILLTGYVPCSVGCYYKIVAMIIVLNSRQVSWYYYYKNLHKKMIMLTNIIKNMIWVDSNCTTSTEAVNKEHEKF